MSGDKNQLSDFRRLGVGIGLRAPHYSHILENRPNLRWFEAISENYLGIEGGTGARPLKILRKIRENYEVVLHGVSMSIGSSDPLDQRYLARLRNLVHEIEPAWISDHLCWTGVGSQNLHDLLPLPYTEEALNHLVPRIAAVQESLKRRVLFENVSSYLEFKHSQMTEWEFLSALAEKADCGILLDINNIYVSSVNHGFDPIAFMDGIAPHRVGQIHLAGHTQLDTHLLDTHDHPVCHEVWQLYAYAVKRFGNVSTLIEWDANIPDFGTLEAEATRARNIQNQ
jgi:uncharacterized protein